jgi:cytochrome P450/NADPH-cytochrome P450 reductase
MLDTVAIPGPKPYPIIGNLLDLQDEVPLHALERLVDIYGPIFKITIRGEERVMVGGFDLFDELCDESRFYKVPPRALQGGDPKAAKGLFTAGSEYDEDWGQAHRILMPAFGPVAIQGMFDGKFSASLESELLSVHLTSFTFGECYE